MRRLSGPYVSRSAESVGCTREQKGHCRSENSTMGTSAVRLPQDGLRGEMGTAASSSRAAATGLLAAATGSTSDVDVARGADGGGAPAPHATLATNSGTSSERKVIGSSKR